MVTLTSPSNPKIKQARLLAQQRKARAASGLFVVEGIRHVGEALQAGAAVEFLCYAPQKLNSPFAQQLVDEQQQAGLPCYAVSEEVFQGLADKENPQGLLAVVRQPQLGLQDLHPETHPWLVALVAPQDPGNIGTILRTIDAVGASGLLLLEDSADPYHPSAVRASMGALFWHPMVQVKSGFNDWARSQGYHLYGTSAHGSQDYRAAGRYQFPCILLLGSERQGLSPAQAAACDALIRLPMRGRVTSLNLAVAAGVMLYAMLESVQE